jgi:hypothetical protein
MSPSSHEAPIAPDEMEDRNMRDQTANVSTHPASSLPGSSRHEFDEHSIWHASSGDEDALSPARGILFGILIGVFMWFALAAAVIIGWHRADTRPAVCTNFPHECAAAVVEVRP